MSILQTTDLLPGDILLYRSSSFIGWAIRCFDDSEHNHAAIWDGDNVIEADAPGVVSRTLAESIKGAQVNVYRVKCATTYEREHAAAVANEYFYEGHKYAYGQILLLAPLVRLRKCRLPKVAWWIRRWTDGAAARLIALHDGKRQPMICSELVARCWDGKIRIIETDQAEPDLVTPGDLEVSPSLQYIGRLS